MAKFTLEHKVMICKSTKIIHKKQIINDNIYLVPNTLSKISLNPVVYMRLLKPIESEEDLADFEAVYDTVN